MDISLPFINAMSMLMVHSVKEQKNDCWRNKGKEKKKAMDSLQL